MHLAGQSHPGLPFVPQAVPGELLGAWLLRVAELYGVSLHALLTRLAVLPLQRRHALHWFELRRSNLEWPSLAAALRRPAAAISDMTAPRCRPRWPQELGCCAQCLAKAPLSGQAITWQRHWM